MSNKTKDSSTCKGQHQHSTSMRSSFYNFSSCSVVAVVVAVTAVVVAAVAVVAVAAAAIDTVAMPLLLLPT